MKPTNRPFEGQALSEVLSKLAQVNAIASSMRQNIEPISDENKEFGAEPVSVEDLQSELSDISS